LPSKTILVSSAPASPIISAGAVPLNLISVLEAPSAMVNTSVPATSKAIVSESDDFSTETFVSESASSN